MAFSYAVDNSGLGVQTRAVARNMGATKALVLDMGAYAKLASYPELVAGIADQVQTEVWDGKRLSLSALEFLCADVDAIYCAETPADFRLFSLAEQRGIRTVLHLNPELDHHYRHPETPRPDVVALPTPWLADRYPGAVMLPMPVEPITVQRGPWALHPCGWAAAKDRNGSRTVFNASLKAERVLVRCQAPPDRPWHNVKVEVADFPTVEDVLKGAQLVIRCRKYAGLDLALQEAMSAGLPVVVGSNSPYAADLPAEAVLPALHESEIELKGGKFSLASPTSECLARKITEIQHDAGLRAHLSDASKQWADADSWGVLRDVWTQVLFR